MAHSTVSQRITKALTFAIVFLMAVFALGQGQDSIRAVNGVLTINIVPSKSYYKVFVDQAITSTVFAGQVPGTTVSVLFLQDSTGHSVAFGGNISAGCTVAQTASATTGCQFLFDSANNQWTAVGGGGGVPGQFSVKTFGAVGDAKKSNTVVTSSNATLTDSTNSPWLSSDVGKKIYCINNTGGLSTLTTTISTITGFTSASSITVSSNGLGAATNSCVWFTQKETTAFLAAGTAAKAALLSASPTVGGPDLAYPAAVTCPPGGYVVDTTFFFQNPATTSNGVSFIGSGPNSCKIYPSPDTTKTTNSWMIYNSNTFGVTISGFSVDCSAFAFNLGGTAMFIDHQNHYVVKDVELDFCGDSGGSASLVNFSNTSNGYIDGLTIFQSSSNTAANAVVFNNGQSVVHARNIYTTNPGPIPLFISNGGTTPGGPRNVTGGGLVIEDSVFDEGGTTGAISVVGTNGVALLRTSGFAGATTVLSVDGNSSVYLIDDMFSPFNGSCSSGTRNAITISSGGIVNATGTSIEGCGATSAITGPAGATFIDGGENDIRNCTTGYPCSLVTAATYATNGFSGGIVPKSTVTHTPNTCYAVTGNLLATAQNICIILLDQNYQLLTITAQSGGTTPANSSCATPPVITLSDGTRSATMTMTSGKAAWNSGVDAVTNLNQVFASGATLTVSIGANTCATPPANVSVNYDLQSVLNP